MIYISDLDGTLLNDDAKLSEKTVEVVKQLNKQGIKFTIATARSYHTAKDFIKQLDLKYPCVLRNGTIIFDPISDEIIKTELIKYEVANEIIEDLLSFGFNPIVHINYKGEESVEYITVDNDGEKHYVQSRLDSQDERFKKVEKFAYSEEFSFISISSIQKNNEKELVILSEKYKEKCSIHSYKDSYSNYSWLEFNYVGADKKSGCEFLLNYLNEDEYTAFGDGYNDLSMLENASKAFIPVNSHLALLGFDLEKIASSNEDGVAQYFLEKLL